MMPALPPQGHKLTGDKALMEREWYLTFAALLNYIAALAPTVCDFTLTANLNLNSANTAQPSSAGLWLVVFLRQDPTGGRTVTWSAPPFRGAPGSLTTTASTWSVCVFVSQVDPVGGVMKWWLVTSETGKT